MKNISLLVWLSQLALSVVVPLVGFIWLGVWLHDHLGWGLWALIVCVILGVVLAVDGLRYSLRIMANTAKDETDEPPAVSFNDHH